MKKGQAAMEFLMTYGWAILVVLVVIGALAYFGVLNPRALVPNRCNIVGEVTCKEVSFSPNTLTVAVVNNAQQSVTLTSLAVTARSGTDAETCTFAALGTPNNGILGVGETGTITCTTVCTDAATCSGKVLDGTIELTYDTQAIPDKRITGTMFHKLD
jgi:uncharacterized protein (UPF0333 family)